MHTNLLYPSLKRSSEKGLQDGWTRVTFIIRQEHVWKIKNLAKKHQKTIKKYIHLILTSYLFHKETTPIPARKNK